MKTNRPVIKALFVPILIGVSLITAKADVLQYDAFLSGPNESPPNASPGTGFAIVDYDNVAHTLLVDVSFSGLLGTTTASHIHAATAVPGTGTAGVATTTPYFTGFPLGVTSGSYSNVLDLTMASSYNPAYVTATRPWFPAARFGSSSRWCRNRRARLCWDWARRLSPGRDADERPFSTVAPG